MRNLKHKAASLCIFGFSILLAINAFAEPLYNADLGPNIFIVSQHLDSFATKKVESLLQLSFKSCEQNPLAAKEFCGFKKNYSDWQRATEWLNLQSQFDIESVEDFSVFEIELQKDWRDTDITTISWGFAPTFDTSDRANQELVTKKVLTWSVLKKTLSYRVQQFKERMLTIKSPTGISLYWTTLPAIDAWAQSPIMLKQLLQVSKSMHCASVLCDFQKRALHHMVCKAATDHSSRAAAALDAIKKESLYYEERVQRLAKAIDINSQVSLAIEESLATSKFTSSTKDYVTQKSDWTSSSLEVTQQLMDQILQIAEVAEKDMEFSTESFLGVKMQAVIDVANACPSSSPLTPMELPELETYRGAKELTALLENDINQSLKSFERLLTNLKLEITSEN